MTYIVVDQRCKDAQTVLTSLVDGPIDSFECFVVEEVYCWLHRERISDTNTKRLRSISMCGDRYQGVHYLHGSTLRWVRGVERCVERLTFWWNHIFIQAEPVDVGTGSCPSFATKVEIAAFAGYVAVAEELFLGTGGSVQDMRRKYSTFLHLRALYNF